MRHQIEFLLVCCVVAFLVHNNLDTTSRSLGYFVLAGIAVAATLAIGEIVWTVVQKMRRR